MTAWQTLCRDLAAEHRDTGGCCAACSRAHGGPVEYPCPRAVLATEAAADDAVFAAFQTPGRRTEAAGLDFSSRIGRPGPTSR